MGLSQTGTFIGISEKLIIILEVISSTGQEPGLARVGIRTARSLQHTQTIFTELNRMEHFICTNVPAAEKVDGYMVQAELLEQAGRSLKEYLQIAKGSYMRSKEAAI